MKTAKTPLSTAFILHCRRSDIFFINRHALSKPRKSYNNSTNSAKEFITAIFKKEYACIIFLNDATETAGGTTRADFSKVSRRDGARRRRVDRHFR